VGAPPITGNSTYINGVFAISGSGSDIWNSADQFQFTDVPVTGNQTIVARVTSQTDTNDWAKAGVMFRSTSAANSPFVMVVQTPAEGVNFMWRNASGNLSYTQHAAVPNPVWLKLVRNGNIFTGYSSTNGINWNTIGSVTLSLPASGLIGLAVCSHDATQISTATFDNVSVQIPTPTAPKIASTSSGSVSLSWNASSLATGYLLQRATDDVNFTTIATLGNVTSYTDSSGLSAGNRYFYRLISTIPSGSSTPSSATAAVTPLLPPTNLKAVAGANKITIIWTAPAGAVTYNIYRGTASEHEGSIPIAAGVTGTSFVDTTASPDVTYYYYVIAFSADVAQSAGSSQVSASFIPLAVVSTPHESSD
jgi:regulation of enolase protein 1 (concanavalin A-like superfamily)